MKRKGFSKLILAGVGLAATAATLTTATYAWYVSNSNVEANGVQGQVASNGSESLYIAKNLVDTQDTTKYSPDKYKAKISYAGGEYTADSLIPQSLFRADTTYTYTKATGNYVAGTTYYAKNEYKVQTVTEDTFATLKAAGLYTEDGGVYTAVSGSYDENEIYYVKEDNYAAVDSTDFTVGETPVGSYYTRVINLEQGKTYIDAEGKKITTPTFISFKYWLKSDTAGDINFVLTVDNITASAAGLTQQAFESTGLPSGTAQGDAFIVDAVHALRMKVTKTKYVTSVNKAADTYALATGTYQAGTAYYQKGADTYEVIVVSADTFATLKAAGLYTEDGGNYTAVTAEEFSDQAVYYKKVEHYSLVDTSEFTAETPVTSYYLRTPGDTTSSYTKATGTGAVQENIYQVDQIALGATGSRYFTEGSTAYTGGVNFVTGGDANSYYYALTNNAPANTGAAGASNDAQSGSASWGTYSLGANEDTLFEFDIWLEGSDKDCFDSCKGQQFTFDFKVELVGA